ncbi:hypothetical protein HYC85_028184 [Camellia sinensis]|uniref:Uncharacterized protein n=1 Tax=Camellia sinensis TaxID=4442 RepID=A0A7J7FUE8_CAMSI|nr:hypothetical protein HYC85_028184 [Camellia sinensis]
MDWEKQQNQQQRQDEVMNSSSNTNNNNGVLVKVMTNEQLEILRKQIATYATICDQLVQMHKSLSSHSDLTVPLQSRNPNIPHRLNAHKTVFLPLLHHRIVSSSSPPSLRREDCLRSIVTSSHHLVRRSYTQKTVYVPSSHRPFVSTSLSSKWAQNMSHKRKPEREKEMSTM